MPTGGRKVSQPLQRPLEHQLRLAGTQPYCIDRHVAVLRVVHIRGTQLDQLDATGNGLLDTTQQRRGFQIFRGNQVLR
ncbi:hypothetical protein D9M72_602250 [compost metagenome]